MTAATALGSREAAVLEQLRRHPGLTATELARLSGLAAQPYRQLSSLQRKALVVGVPVWHRDQARNVTHWRPAPPGTVPPPGPDPAELRRRRERDTAAQRASRARRNPPRRPGPVVPALAGAACKSADPDLFFAPEFECTADWQARIARAKAVCARCAVRDACLAYALDTAQWFGIWGGLTEDERRALLRQRRAS